MKSHTAVRDIQSPSKNAFPLMRKQIFVSLKLNMKSLSIIEKPHALLSNALDQAVIWEYISSDPAEWVTLPQYRSAGWDVWSANEAPYAWNWYHIYAAPTIATAATYKRQLTKYIIPACKDLFVEDITVDIVQQLFNSMDGAKATKDKAKVVLNQIFDFTVEDKLLSKNPLKSG